MPGRISRSSVSAAALKGARRKNKKRSFDAYAQAQQLVPEKGPAQHRAGEYIDDNSKQKRRRHGQEGNESDEDKNIRNRLYKHSAKHEGDDDIEYASDPDGHELTLGGLADEDGDSELDSDEAFGESDEEKFEGFTFRGSSSGKGKAKAKRKGKAIISQNKRGEVNLNEEEESEVDDGDSQDDEGLGFGDDAVDLAAMLDDDDEEILGGKDTTRKDLGEESEQSEDSESDVGEDEDDEDEEDDDTDSDADLALERSARLQDRLAALDAPSGQTTAPVTVDAPTWTDFAADDRAAEKSSSKSRHKATKDAKISAPLPKRQQDRLDREVATTKAISQLDRWKDTVIRNRRAEFLNFPLASSSNYGAIDGERFSGPNHQKPQNELEEKIQHIMEESGLVTKPGQSSAGDGDDGESTLLKAEGLAEKKLPVEEVMRRRAELRRARELLFREEIKAKRIAKIKSKSYRRVHRKERERQAEQEREALEGLGLDPIDENERDKADRRRAEARMGAKHKDSKWAKSLKQTNRTAWDDDARDGVIEQARRAEELKKRIAGRQISDDERSDLLEDDEDVSDGEPMLQRLETLKSESSSKGQGLAGLKFMRAADERRRKQNDEDVERLRKELAVANGDEVESDVDDEGLGRAIYGPQGKKAKHNILKEPGLEFEAPEHSDLEIEGELDSDQEDKRPKRPSPSIAGQTGPKSILKKPNTVKKPFAQDWLKGTRPDEEHNVNTTKSAWLKVPKASSKKTSVDVDVVTLKSASTEDGSRELTKLQKGKAAKSDIDKTAGGKSHGRTIPPSDVSDSEANELADAVPTNKGQNQSFMERAFAGDDVQAAFEAEKQDMVDSEEEKEVSNHLPGWGSWTGDGLSKATRKQNHRAKHNPLLKTKIAGVKQADRKDAGLKNVIISEKQDRKGKKYLAPALPHDFETQEQYERSRRMPMGPEWTTKEVHQRMTRPRVVIKPGVNVQALERPIA